MRFLQLRSDPQVKGVTVRPGMTVDGRYRLVSSLARGWSGEVWLARDVELDREVVLKRPVPRDAADAERAWAEARALARFSHPHVVTLYHAVRASRPRGGLSWLVMEHAPGGSLEGCPAMSPVVAARIGAQIAGALAALHAEGIVHCDVKPGNVVLTGDGTAKLTDFGAAYRVGGSDTLTPNGAVSYTPDYAAPEVVRGRPEPRSDVFSLGATLHTLLIGNPTDTPHLPTAGDADARPSRTLDAADADARSSRTLDAADADARLSRTLDADGGPLREVLAAMLRRNPADRPDAAETRRLLDGAATRPAPRPPSIPWTIPAPAPAPEAASAPIAPDATAYPAPVSRAAALEDASVSDAAAVAEGVPAPRAATSHPGFAANGASVADPAAPTTDGASAVDPAAPTTDSAPPADPAAPTTDSTPATDPAAPTTDSTPATDPAATAKKTSPPDTTDQSTASMPGTTVDSSVTAGQDTRAVLDAQAAPDHTAAPDGVAVPGTPAGPGAPTVHGVGGGGGAGWFGAWGRGRVAVAVSVVVLAILVPLGLVAWRDEGTTAAWDGSGPMPSWGDGGFATSDEGDPLFAWEDGYRERTAPPSDEARRGADVIGDRRTADPCALLRPATLGRFGPAELDPDLGNFDRCHALVRPPGGPVVDVEVGFDLDPPPEQAPPARVTGDVAVVEGPAQSHACTRTLTVAGVIGTTVTITAERDSTGTAPLCEIADAATGDAANTLNQGVIARRPPPPSHSLAHRDACTLLDAKALEVVPGVDAAAADRGFGGWGCDWASTTGDVRVGLRFHRGPPPDAAGGASTQVNGLRAFVRPGGDGDETCLVEVPYRAYAGRTGQTAAESLRLVASGSAAEEELCRMAAGLAGSAAARLPRP